MYLRSGSQTMVAGAYTMSHACNKHTHTHGESQAFVVSIFPSCHMLWRTAEGALFWELEAVLFWDTLHKDILKGML